VEVALFGLEFSVNEYLVDLREDSIAGEGEHSQLEEVVLLGVLSVD